MPSRWNGRSWRGREELCRCFLEGGYILREASQEPLVHLLSCGAMIPEAWAAAEFLEHEGIGVNLIHLCSPRRAYRDWRTPGGGRLLAGLIAPHQRTAPIVTVLDGAAGALAWVGGVFDVDSILQAAFEAIDTLS